MDGTLPRCLVGKRLFGTAKAVPFHGGAGLSGRGGHTVIGAVRVIPRLEQRETWGTRI